MAQHVKLAVLSDEVAADTQTLVYNQDTNRWDPAVPDSGTSEIQPTTIPGVLKVVKKS